jgi:hypothetical protein
MASIEETSAESNNIPPSSGSNEDEKSSSTNEKDSGFECNVSLHLFSIENLLLVF